MKKLLALLLALSLVFVLAACGSSGEDAVKKYVDDNKDGLDDVIDYLDTMYTSAGFAGEWSYKADGAGIVFTLKLDGANDVDSATKEALQESLDTTMGQNNSMLEEMQKELPELEYVSYQFCEEDGDLIAEAVLGDK